ncbi:MAG TPA: hypothetical protein EYP23_02420, partial [Thermoplasmata archaeon]|nr:hypothetical protein [Thermoplasmata archaeon]
MDTVRFSTVFIVMMMATALVGITYAHWTATLTITGTVETGSIKPVFTDAFTDDDGTADDSTKDANDNGYDPKEGGKDPKERWD